MNPATLAELVAHARDIAALGETLACLREKAAAALDGTHERAAREVADSVEESLRNEIHRFRPYCARGALRG